MPQLDVTTYASQLFWLVVTFGLLFIVMARVIIPRIGGVLEDRESLINGDLAKAEELKANTEKAIAEYEQKLAEARASAQASIAAEKAKLTAEIDARKAEVEADLAKQSQAAEAKIAEQREQAMSALADVASDTAGALVAKLTGGTADDTRIRNAVNTAAGGNA